MDESAATELPNEILSAIVEIAAGASSKNCHSLSLVSHSFNIWTAPTLYDRLDCLTPKKAQAFLPLVLQKPPNYFSRRVHVKSISFAEMTPMPVVKAILAQCSQRLISFSVRSTEKGVHPGKYFALVKSPFLRRLCLIWTPEGTPTISNPFENSWRGGYLTGTSSPYNCIGVNLFSSVTHFIGYTPHISSSGNRYLTWGNLTRSTDPAHNPFRSSFQRLTHLAMSTQNLDFVRDLLLVAQNIRYVAFLHHEVVKSWLVSRIRWEIEDRLRVNREDWKRWKRRYVVVNVKKVGEVNLVDSGEQGLFWRKVEKLVDGGFCSDSGYRWDDLPSAS